MYLPPYAKVIIYETYTCTDILETEYLRTVFIHRIQMLDIFDDFPVITIVIKKGSLIYCNDAIATVKSDLEG